MQPSPQSPPRRQSDLAKAVHGQRLPVMHRCKNCRLPCAVLPRDADRVCATADADGDRNGPT